MANFIYSFSNLTLYVAINLLFIIFSLIALALVRHYSSLKEAYHENEVIGYVSATICIIYAIFIGFIAFYLLDNFSKAEDATKLESAHVALMYYDTKFLPEPLRTKIQADIDYYLDSVIHVEWPMMLHSVPVSPKNLVVISNILNELPNQKATNNLETLALQETFKDTKKLYEARKTRVYLAGEALGGDIWIIILVAGILTIAVNYFFGMKLYLHVGSIVAVCLIVGSSIYLIVVLDRPFQGEFHVPNTPFQAVVDMIKIDKSAGR